MSIAPAKKQYENDEDIEVRVLFKNLTEEEIRIQRLGDGARDYRIALYFPDGNLVPKSEYGEKFEDSLSRPLQTYSIRGQYIKPKDFGSHYLRIGRYFNIEKEGTYFLVMMRRITDSWEDGFLISNMTTINILNKKEE